jgi:hypothetical protein
MQCLLVVPTLLCVFVGVACLVLCGTHNALLASMVVIFSSNNIATSLCCYNVDRFIPIVVIMRYDYKLVLNTVVKKLFVVGTCKP